MNRIRYIFTLAIMFALTSVSMTIAAQQRQEPSAWKVGDQVEAYIRYTWQGATIIKTLNGKFTDFEVVVERTDGKKGPGISNFEVSKDDIRQRGESKRLAPRPAKSGEGPRLGQYRIYAGVPPQFLGHFVLMPAGRYKVARSSKEEYFGEGEYSFESKTSTVKWVSGPFKNNGWGGLFEIQGGGETHRIEFNRTTFGGNYGE